MMERAISDPDAGYDGHKGEGYQSQIMETYSENSDAPCLITHVAVEAAHEHDSHALIPAIEDAAENGFAPKEILADSLYGSDENVQDAALLGVEVISPVLGMPKLLFPAHRAAYQSGLHKRVRKLSRCLLSPHVWPAHVKIVVLRWRERRVSTSVTNASRFVWQYGALMRRRMNLESDTDGGLVRKVQTHWPNRKQDWGS